VSQVTTKEARSQICCYLKRLPILIVLAFGCQAQTTTPAPNPSKTRDSEKKINVNWLYGSYIPKDAPRVALNGRERVTLYFRQTYVTPGIYAKTTLFAVRDQISERFPEWGDGFPGFAKRLADRQAQFIIQNSVSALGNGVVGWEPRYDRCNCEHFWPRTRHAIARNFVTYDRTEKSLRPQIMPYLGAFSASATATLWQPGNPSWQIKGYQAAVTQVFIGTAVNWLAEFAPEITRVLRRKKGHSPKNQPQTAPPKSSDSQ
jgi:hypothetical protein